MPNLSLRFCITLAALSLAACAAATKQPVTAAARTSVSNAQASASEARKAAERAIVHLDRADYKGSRALWILDHPDGESSQERARRILEHPLSHP